MSLVTSSTDTSNEHDTDIEGPPPLPPPRPKHWARKVKEQNMGLGGEQSQGHKKNDDWYQTDPKFPLPKFKPTLSGKNRAKLIIDHRRYGWCLGLSTGLSPLWSGFEPGFGSGSYVS